MHAACDKGSELPSSIQNVLPPHTQDIYKESFNNAFEQYKDPGKRKEGSSLEETAHRIAWEAVKSQYQKGNDGNPPRSNYQYRDLTTIHDVI